MSLSLDRCVTVGCNRRRSPLRLAYDTVWDPLHMNLVRMAFQPCHVFHLTVLPPQQARDGEAHAAFAQRVAAQIAAELRVPATAHTTAQKRDLLLPLKQLGKAAFLRAAAGAKRL